MLKPRSWEVKASEGFKAFCATGVSVFMHRRGLGDFKYPEGYAGLWNGRFWHFYVFCFSFFSFVVFPR